MESVRMSDDRDEEVRRLRTAFMREAGLITGPPSASFARMLTFYGRDVAEMMYDAGARIPDPPRPTLPVVSEDAVFALLNAGGECSEHGTRVLWQCAGCVRRMQAGLRAAFPVMLRDSVAALHLGPFDNISNETMHAIFRQLTGSDAHP